MALSITWVCHSGIIIIIIIVVVVVIIIIIIQSFSAEIMQIFSF